MTHNPWITSVEPSKPVTPDVVRDSRGPILWGPGHVTAKGRGGLRSAPCPGDGALWFVGAHGGAGASTLAHLLHGGDAGQLWPAPRSGSVSAIVVARHHRSGLHAAQDAAIQWASGAIAGVDLLGVVLVPDSAVKRPKALIDLERLVGGAFPTVWRTPYVPVWRVEDPGHTTVPRPMKKVLAHIEAAYERKNS